MLQCAAVTMLGVCGGRCDTVRRNQIRMSAKFRFSEVGTVSPTTNMVSKLENRLIRAHHKMAKLCRTSAPCTGCFGAKVVMNSSSNQGVLDTPSPMFVRVSSLEEALLGGTHHSLGGVRWIGQVQRRGECLGAWCAWSTAEKEGWRVGAERGFQESPHRGLKFTEPFLSVPGRPQGSHGVSLSPKHCGQAPVMEGFRTPPLVGVDLIGLLLRLLTSFRFIFTELF